MTRHKFKLTIHGTVLMTPVSFDKISDRFKNIELIPITDNDYELIVNKRAIDPIETTHEEAIIEANNLVDRLALIDNHNVSNLIYQGYINSSGQFSPVKVNSKSTAQMTALIADPLKFYEQTANKKLFLSSKNLGAVRTYRSAIGINDEISQYLIHYGLLLILKGEKQKDVDGFIKKEISDILIVNGKHGDETIITNIRNMIAHPKESFDMKDLKKKVNDYLPTIRKLVLKILRAQ